MSKVTLPLILSALAIFLLSSAAQAQATRTWVVTTPIRAAGQHPARHLPVQFRKLPTAVRSTPSIPAVRRIDHHQVADD